MGIASRWFIALCSFGSTVCFCICHVPATDSQVCSVSRFDMSRIRGPVYSRQASFRLEKDGPVIAVRRGRRRPWRFLYVRQIDLFAGYPAEPISPVSTFLKLKSYGTAMGKIHGVSLARIGNAVIALSY